MTDFTPGDDANGGVSSDTGAMGTAVPRMGFWSPFSDEESVAGGQVRFWAIVETLSHGRLLVDRDTPRDVRAVDY
jgi:hypothetical protein